MPDLEACKAYRDCRATKVQLVHKVIKARLDHRARRARWGRKDLRDQRDQKGRLARREQLISRTPWKLLVVNLP